MGTRVRIGDALLNAGVITEDKLKNALAEQQSHGGKLGDILVELGYVTDQVLFKTLSQQLDLPYIDLRQHNFDESIVSALPEVHARRYRAIIIDKESSGYLVGMSDPQDIFAVNEITRLLQQPIKLALVEESVLLKSLDSIYRNREEISNLADQLSEELGFGGGTTVTQDDNDAENVDAAPVVKLLYSIFSDALSVSASDIHIEPEEKIWRIRLRVDGVLQEQIMKNKNIVGALTQRLKLMAGLNIAERRLPQDGRFSIKMQNNKVDFRISTMPVEYGESVVMRVLSGADSEKTLAELGMPANVLERFDNLISLPTGLVVVTGPTGSGKTTTLYSALGALNDEGTKIITAEDPIEFSLARISQVQINSKIDLDFARVLRAVLRQDPDIVLVGEIRDGETAEIAARAALTGHLVLATLHTNDAPTAAMRLVDMGVESYIIAAALRGVLAQRLVRRVCKDCMMDYTPDERELAWLSSISQGNFSNKTYKIGKGCSQCNDSGYTGRAGVYELQVLDEPMIEALRNDDSNAYFKAVAENESLRPLAVSALDLAVEGITSISEAMSLAENLDV